jgi:hypothetical protein
MIPARHYVFERAGYKCELCGRSHGNSAESTLTIQHMRGVSNDPMDLKAYCFESRAPRLRCRPDLIRRSMDGVGDDQAETEHGQQVLGDFRNSREWTTGRG